MIRTIFRRPVAALLVFLAIANSALSQDTVLKEISPEQLEKILGELKFEAKKSFSKKKDEAYFDFMHSTFATRLTSFDGKDLMLDCVFPALSMEKANTWNTKAKFSRVSIQKEGGNFFSILEFNFDVSGGVSVNAVKQFITRFGDELKEFNSYVGTGGLDEKILAAVSNDTIGNILKTMGFAFQKKDDPKGTGVTAFDFEVGAQKLRLYNFNGKELLIDAHFKAIPLEQANQYNLSRKFVRAVNYKVEAQAYTALESCFDCEAGVTEGMLRQFFASFGDEVKQFSEFTQKSAK
jgi:hypothetical protein